MTDEQERLILALRQANALPEPPKVEKRESTLEEDVIYSLANELFITNEGRVNYAAVNEFERLAPCKIFPVEQDSFGWLIGGIKYYNRTYYFG